MVPECSSSIFIPVIQPVRFTLSGSYRNDGTADAVQKMVLVCILFQNVFAYLVTLCVYQIGTLVTGGGFGVGTAVAFVVVAVMLFLLFRPDPYKDQKVYSKRSVNA